VVQISTVGHLTQNKHLHDRVLSIGPMGQNGHKPVNTSTLYKPDFRKNETALSNNQNDFQFPAPLNVFPQSIRIVLTVSKA
jgi:hypothetical protein